MTFVQCKHTLSEVADTPPTPWGCVSVQTEPSELDQPVALAQLPLPVWHGERKGPSLDPKEERRRELLLAGIAVLLFALFVGGIEGALRLLHVRAEDGALGPLHRYSEVYGWEPRPSFRMVDEGRVTTINARGYRGPELPTKRSDRFRVVILGDSIAFGLEAGDDETFARVLEAHAGVEVANLSVQGYDPGQELIKLEREGLPLKPDVVVLALCLNNDFADVALPVFLYDGLHPKPFFRIEEGRLVEHSEHLRLSLRQKTALFLREHSRLYGLVEARRAEDATRPEIEHWTRRMKRVLEDRAGVIDLTARLVGRMAEDCRQAGVGFVVLAFPDKDTFHGDKSWVDGLTASLSERNVPLVDMAERFQARKLLFSEIAADNIGHLNARGHQAAADILQEVLAEVVSPPAPAAFGSGSRG
jgi:lysophospholipase L1-like esterase